MALTAQEHATSLSLKQAEYFFFFCSISFLFFTVRAFALIHLCEGTSSNCMATLVPLEAWVTRKTTQIARQPR